MIEYFHNFNNIFYTSTTKAKLQVNLNRPVSFYEGDGPREIINVTTLMSLIVGERVIIGG